MRDKCGSLVARLEAVSVYCWPAAPSAGIRRSASMRRENPSRRSGWTTVNRSPGANDDNERPVA